MYRRLYEPQKRDRNATYQRYDGANVYAVLVFILAAPEIEIADIQLGPADDEIIGDHDAGDRTQEAGISYEPAGDVGLRIAEQFPGHHSDADDSGADAARAERDASRIQVREI